nr:HAMP domain-containing protein [Anaerolineae bacterium]
MLYNLRLALLLAMLTVAAVAIVTITLLAGLATRLEFSRYVAYAGAIQDEQVQQAVLTFYEQQQRSSTQPPIPHPPNAFISLLPEDTSDMIFLYPLTVNRPRGTPDTPGSLSFETAADGSVVIRDGDSIMGRLEIDPATQLALQPAQSAFVQFVNQSLLLAAGLAAVAAVLLTLILSQQVHQPIRALTMAARQMENGRLSQRVQTRIRGEIGDLAHAFNAMADALSRNELLRRQMVNDIAHELRTPLTNIRGYLEAMQDGIVSPEPATIDLVYEEAMLLNNIIQDLQEL